MVWDETLPGDLPSPHAGQPVVTAGAPRGAAGAAVVCLHGRGATAQGAINLYEPVARHGVAFVAPQAARSRWLPHAVDAPRERNEPHRSSAVAVVDAVLDRTREALNLSVEEVVLTGFSQGASVAAEYAAESGGRHPLALLSGGLLGPTIDQGSSEGCLDRAPVLIAGGAADERVPIERLAATARVLKALGADVTRRAYEGVGHEVTDDEFAWLGDLLAERLDD
ncbi:alpha/beta hydrolase [Halobaculum gomorrense]|uniref:Phospholipase/carboxylesterase n=1 Tax=Halobaculum gomorrense TaxID=43928 RepID=A0A1M5K0J0_9EURY|nr:dienelactone hydrolase family protein [Halobaculum gomorrense]SHG46288.1 phospholipase/carboxylesterase [Halobaculum gomorrense]